MPITKQVIKRMKQAQVRQQRNQHYKSRMKSMIKLVLDHVQKKDADKANKALSDAYKAIDTAAKKGIIHRNNAAHKKSRVQKAVSSLSSAKAK